MLIGALIKLDKNGVASIDNLVSLKDVGDMNNYLSINGGDYSYICEVSKHNPIPDVGWVLDPISMKFNDPNKETNAVQNLTAAIESVHTNLMNCLSISSNVSPDKKAEAVKLAMSSIDQGGEWFQKEIFDLLLTVIAK